MQRQVTDGGFQGRRNKPSDTCYAFWLVYQSYNVCTSCQTREEPCVILLLPISPTRVGGVLKIIGAYHLLNRHALREFLLTCQSPVMTETSFITTITYSDESSWFFSSLYWHSVCLLFVHQYGGFTKFPRDRIPDIYHSYYGLAALSLLDEERLEPLCVELGIISAGL
jgi:geranylgeranyl transferase type-1 subunit beta